MAYHLARFPDKHEDARRLFMDLLQTAVGLDASEVHDSTDGEALPGKVSFNLAYEDANAHAGIVGKVPSDPETPLPEPDARGARRSALFKSSIGRRATNPHRLAHSNDAVKVIDVVEGMARDDDRRHVRQLARSRAEEGQDPRRRLCGDQGGGRGRDREHRVARLPRGLHRGVSPGGPRPLARRRRGRRPAPVVRQARAALVRVAPGRPRGAGARARAALWPTATRSTPPTASGWRDTSSASTTAATRRPSTACSGARCAGSPSKNSETRACGTSAAPRAARDAHVAEPRIAIASAPRHPLLHHIRADRPFFNRLLGELPEPPPPDPR